MKLKIESREGKNIYLKNRQYSITDVAEARGQNKSKGKV